MVLVGLQIRPQLTDHPSHQKRQLTLQFLMQVDRVTGSPKILFLGMTHLPHVNFLLNVIHCLIHLNATYCTLSCHNPFTSLLLSTSMPSSTERTYGSSVAETPCCIFPTIELMGGGTVFGLDCLRGMRLDSEETSDFC